MSQELARTVRITERSVQGIGRHVETIERWRMYRHILISIDGSELAEHAVTNGLALAKSVGAKVSVIVVEQPFVTDRKSVV